MDWLPLDFDFLAGSAERAIAHHRAAVGGDVSWRNRRGQELRRRVVGDLDYYQAHIARLRPKFGFAKDATHQRVIVEDLRAANLALDRLGGVVSWLLAANHPDSAAVPVLFAEEAGRALLRRSCEVTVVTDADPVYATPVPTAAWA